MGGGDVRTLDMVEDPADLGGREVGVNHQPGAAPDLLGAAKLPQLGTERLAAPVLPDDRVVDGLAGAAVPDHGGLALVGDADGLDVARGQPGLGDGLAGGGELRLPDFFRVVFYPAGLGVDLAELALRHRDNLSGIVEHDAARAGRALV